MVVATCGQPARAQTDGSESSAEPHGQSPIIAAWNNDQLRQGIPPSPILSSCSEPTTGDVWLGTFGAGLVRYSGGCFTAFTQLNSGLAGNIVFDVESFGGTIWAVTNGGVSRLEPGAGRWNLCHARTANLPHTAITDLWVENEKQLCAGEWLGRSLMYDEQRDDFVASDNRGCNPVLRASPTSASPIDFLTSPGERESRPSIAVYGPRNRTVVIPRKDGGMESESGRPDLASVQKAIEGANRAGGYRGQQSFELAMVFPGYANYAWGLPEDDIVLFARQSDILGTVGFIADGEHITDAVISLTNLPWVNVAPPDAALTHEGRPDRLIFQCFGDEPRQHRAVFDYAIERSGGERIALIAGTDEADARHVQWWRDHAKRRHVTPAADLQWTTDGLSGTVHELARVDVIFVSSKSAETLDLIRVIRTAGYAGLIVTGPELMGSAHAGTNLCNVLVFVPGNADSSADGLTSRTARATDHLLFAINLAGSSRAAVREMLAALSQTAFGEEHFERHHAPSGVSIAEFVDGEWQRMSISGDGLPLK